MNLIDRVKNIITKPNTEWDVIDAEQTDSGKIITGYVLPLAGAAALAAFIGYAFIGVNYFGFRVKGVNWGLYQALTVFIGAIVSVFITSFIVDALAPSFGSEKNYVKSLKLVAYSYTPAWIGGLLAIFPVIGIVGALFGIYGLYLMYIGMPKLKKTPADKHVGYFVVTLIVTIIVYLVIGWILTRILLSVFGLNYGNYLSL
ncbi:MAG TPA: Yip1 family protein [Chitinophagaceae bacterium]|nr:Yip1 family protein [Chitinophagaceae bacterium]